eukprot:5288675-Pyramimonas_sp.AAC.1
MGRDFGQADMWPPSPPLRCPSSGRCLRSAGNAAAVAAPPPTRRSRWIACTMLIARYFYMCMPRGNQNQKNKKLRRVP